MEKSDLAKNILLDKTCYNCTNYLRKSGFCSITGAGSDENHSCEEWRKKKYPELDELIDLIKVDIQGELIKSVEEEFIKKKL